MINLEGYLSETQQAFQAMSAQAKFIRKISEEIFSRVKKGGTIYWAGNGGSAGDSQHLACELVSKFMETRASIKSVALTTNTSLITAISNDYGFENIFSRQVEAFLGLNDVLILISTSGESKNILEVAKLGRERNALLIGLTNKSKNSLSGLVDFCYNAPTLVTGIAQQCHITFGQAICLELERMIIEETQ